MNISWKLLFMCIVEVFVRLKCLEFDVKCLENCSPTSMHLQEEDEGWRWKTMREQKSENSEKCLPIAINTQAKGS